ncbi:hypothetical protein [Aeromonas enteropelogenes]|uniref:hypothetical protein n=1 Tax=Aeromonas enteropelogenes TaxID=29489 RepID=UPI003B9E0F94
MSEALCICPNFISKHISNISTFTSVFMGSFINSSIQIVFDQAGRIKLEHLNAVQNDPSAFELYKVWSNAIEIEGTGKILNAAVANPASSDIKSLIYNTISIAPTTFNKGVVVYDNNEYAEFVDELRRQRIELLNLQNLTPQAVNRLSRCDITYYDLEHDLAWVIQRLSRLSNRGLTEDDYNDYIRDLMLAKQYEVKDQSREGYSSSGVSAGELDLLIENKGHLFSIVEAMKLTSLDSTYINTHYQKLMRNYNPLSVKRTFMITYYEGSRFDGWWSRYVNYINELSPELIGLDSEANVTHVDELETPYLGLKKLTQHFTINHEHFACVHYAIKLSR